MRLPRTTAALSAAALAALSAAALAAVNASHPPPGRGGR